MQPTPSPRYARIATLILAVLLISIVAFIVYRVALSATFRVTGTNPKISAMATISPFLKINFSRQLSDKGLSVSAVPATLVSSYHVDGKTLVINFNNKAPLSDSTTYTITVNSISDTNGHRLTGKTFSFKPKYVDSSSLPTDQFKALKQGELNYNKTHNDPIMVYLPYQTADYTLSGSYDNSGKFSLHATIYLSRAAATNQDVVVSQDKQDIASYIQSHGFDPAKYDIQYDVQSL